MIEVTCMDNMLKIQDRITDRLSDLQESTQMLSELLAVVESQVNNLLKNLSPNMVASTNRKMFGSGDTLASTDGGRPSQGGQSHPFPANTMNLELIESLTVVTEKTSAYEVFDEIPCTLEMKVPHQDSALEVLDELLTLDFGHVSISEKQKLGAFKVFEGMSNSGRGAINNFKTPVRGKHEASTIVTPRSSSPLLIDMIDNHSIHNSDKFLAMTWDPGGLLEPVADLKRYKLKAVNNNSLEKSPLIPIFPVQVGFSYECMIMSFGLANDTSTFQAICKKATMNYDVVKPLNQVLSSLADQDICQQMDHDNVSSDSLQKTYSVNEIEVHILELEKSSGQWETRATIPMQPSENALTVQIVTLFHSATKENDTMLAIGTGYVQGEDVAAIARVLLFSIGKSSLYQIGIQFDMFVLSIGLKVSCKCGHDKLDPSANDASGNSNLSYEELPECGHAHSVGAEMDIMWTVFSWICGKRLVHYRAFSRNETTISTHSFVLIRSEGELGHGSTVKCGGSKRIRHEKLGQQKLLTDHFGVRLSGHANHLKNLSSSYQNLMCDSTAKRPLSVKFIGPHSGSTPLFKIDERIELHCQDSGIRGSWFKGTVLQLSLKRLKVCYDDVQNENGCGNLEEWIPALKTASTDKVNMGCKGSLTTRPCPSTDYLPENLSLSIGTVVDAWWKDGWWEGLVIRMDNFGEDSLQVYLPGANMSLTCGKKCFKVSRDYFGNKSVAIEAKPDILSEVFIHLSGSEFNCMLYSTVATQAYSNEGDMQIEGGKESPSLILITNH